MEESINEAVLGASAPIYLPVRLPYNTLVAGACDLGMPMTWQAREFLPFADTLLPSSEGAPVAPDTEARPPRYLVQRKCYAGVELWACMCLCFCLCCSCYIGSVGVFVGFGGGGFIGF